MGRGHDGGPHGLDISPQLESSWIHAFCGPKGFHLIAVLFSTWGFLHLKHLGLPRVGDSLHVQQIISRENKCSDFECIIHLPAGQFLLSGHRSSPIMCSSVLTFAHWASMYVSGNMLCMKVRDSI